MLDAIVDQSTFVYILLIIICSGLLFAWRRTRKWGYLAGTAVGLLLVVGMAVLAQVVVTDQKKIETAIQSAAAAVEKHDMATIERNLARDFQFLSTDKKAFLEKGDALIRSGEAAKVEVWDMHLDSIDKKNGTARISFMSKPKGRRVPDATHFRVEAELVRESDGQWRLRTFQLFKPFVQTSEPSRTGSKTARHNPRIALANEPTLILSRMRLGWPFRSGSPVEASRWATCPSSPLSTRHRCRRHADFDSSNNRHAPPVQA